MNTKRYIITFLLLLLGIVVFTACTSSEEAQVAETEEHAEDDSEMDSDHGHVEAPDEFADLTNAFADNEAAIAAGKTIFDASCASCHGPEGLGDGPAAAALDPQPATLADGAMMGGLSDGYLFWRVSKGGAIEPFNSAMPGWESGLTEKQRWQVISYIRALSNGDVEHADTEDGGHSD